MKVITKGREDQKTPNLDDMDGRWSLNKLVDFFSLASVSNDDMCLGRKGQIYEKIVT